MKEQLSQYKTEMENELKGILNFWQKNTTDDENGGFYGRLDNSNKVFADAPKGSVLNSRILWTFSAAFNLTKNTDYLRTAERAFNYIKDYFIDKKFGGVYWTVDHKGKPLDTKKQIYALAFAIYGLSEFYISSKNEEAKGLAINLFNLILEHSHDHENGGYIEAFSGDWKDLSDLRLSKKDANEKKSMNTHLHLLEAFANLYRVCKNEKLEERISELIFIFLNHIIDPETHHLILFFDEKWNQKSNTVSYGHDIEAAWLIQEAAEVVDNPSLIKQLKKQSVLIAKATTDGLDIDGGLWYEYDLDEDALIKEKHWWPQAEAMVGFFNAWQITKDDDFLQRSLSSWKFIQQHILDKKNGEWFWGIKEDNTIMDKDKAGIWKCPYHNSRALMEIIKRIERIQ
ncbi:MAG: AGE family epimerase/isomerase [Bacteroidota bacterium]|nr:AGE family epimerase/isomerase [Bacteroidota bacterium]